MTLVEICVDSVQSALNAVAGGADRLELCGNLGVGGGTTPSIGLLKAVQRAVNIPIMVMIRPRCGDFVYSDSEIEVMLEDIKVFKQHSVQGIVVGILTPNGKVALEPMKKIVDAASPVQVCFHRAVDMTRDPVEAVQDIQNIGGICRVLTSGQHPSALDGLGVIKTMASVCGPGLRIMPGSGINGKTIESILQHLQPLEVHLSAAQWIDSDMKLRREGLGMGVGGQGEWSVWRTLESLVREVREICDRNS